MILTDADELREALRLAAQERDAALVEAKRLAHEVNYWKLERKDVMRMVRRTAERQREACAVTVENNVDDLMLRKGLSEDVRDTKLVTEPDWLVTEVEP